MYGIFEHLQRGKHDRIHDGKIDVEPWFDMELFMGVSQETRLGGDVMDRFMTLWKNWLPHLTVKGIDTGKIKYLLVALDESVEQDVDKAWEGSPSNAFLYNALAQTMCMAAVHAVIPEVQDAGCAPAPKPTATLREALEAEGIPYSNDKASHPVPPLCRGNALSLQRGL